jgi:hypothetical protein
MTKDQVLRLVKAEVRRLQRSFYSNSGDAFTHFLVRHYFDLDEDFAYEYADIGGRNDKGIDAFWVDEDERRVVILQAKYSEAGAAKADRDVVINLGAAYAWLRRLATSRVSSANDAVRAAARQLEELRRIDPEYPVVLYCAAFGRFTPTARDEAERFNNQHESDHVRMELIDFNAIKDALEEEKSRDAPAIGEPIDLELRQAFEFAPAEGQPRTLVGVVDAADLGRIERQYRHRIFQENVRYYLRSTQKVNKSIAETIGTTGGREKFWYFNNGIAIVCDEFERLGDDEQTVRIHNLQIVNGCQTTTTLGEGLDHLEGDGSRAYVLVRIVESSDPELKRDITLFNNRQTAVRDRDLMSNDSHQDRLQAEFNQLDPPWFYERKRGEWDAMIHPSPALRARYGKPPRRIDNEAAAQAAYAFYFDPGEARARKRFLFMPAAENGFYDQIFHRDTSAEWLLLPFCVADYVGRKRAEYLQQYKGVNQARPSNEGKRLLAMDWMKFADQMLIGSVGYFIRRRRELDPSDLHELLTDSLDELLSTAYNHAYHDLSVLFGRKHREYAIRQEPFSAANYVKGNWNEVREALETEEELRESQGIDIFENVPLLRSS